MNLMSLKSYGEWKPTLVPTARDYVQDGLVAMWDGIENAGWGVHDASATVWKDLAGVRDMSLGASFSFEDDCANISSVKEVASFDPFVTSDIKTIEVVIEPLGINGVVFLAFAGSTTTTRWFGIRANSTFNFGQTAAASNVASPLSRHYYAGTTEDTASESAIPFDNYLDGVRVPSAGNGMSWGYSWKGRGAVNLVSTSFGGGRIYSIRIYNRALTADEIAANYAVDKARFNLGGES